jgi:hypothetical protein
LASVRAAAAAAAAAANVDEVRRRRRRRRRALPATDNGGGPGVRGRDKGWGFMIVCWLWVLVYTLECTCAHTDVRIFWTKLLPVADSGIGADTDIDLGYQMKW